MRRLVGERMRRVRGRKRNLLEDTKGLVLIAKVYSAKVSTWDESRLLLKSTRERLPHLSHLGVDSGYQGRGQAVGRAGA
jgi:hypothetical protein